MFDFLKQTVTEFLDDKCMRMAAALAYYTVFALPPVFVILLTVTGLYYSATQQGGTEAARAKMQEQIKLLVGPAASKETEDVLKNASTTGGGWKWVLSIGGVIIGATGVVIALQDSLNEAWEVQPDPEAGGIKNFLLKRVLSLGMILSIGFILLVSMLLTTWINDMFGAGSGFLVTVVSFAIVTLLFAGMFKYLPDAVVGWKEVLIGGLVTAVLFSIGKYALTLFLSQASFSSFGSAAALAVLLAWVYYSAVILLYGAEFTQVWAKTYGTGITPEPGAVRVVTTTEKVKAQ